MIDRRPEEKMEKAVLTVFGRHESEKIIEKSRVLT